MKKIPSIVLALFVFCSSVSAQKINESNVPPAVKQAFTQKYPGLTGKWEKEKNDYEVNFKKDGKSMSALIDAKGAILETETDISVKELPESITSYIKLHYKGSSIKEAAIVVKASGETIYEAEVNKKDLLFDQNGKFIKEEKEEED